MTRTILAITTGLLVAAALVGSGTPARALGAAASPTHAAQSVARPLAAVSESVAMYALPVPTIGGVDLGDCVGLPILWILAGEDWWRIDPGSIVVEAPASVVAFA
jgi:hypothetical protein